ncbi:MAG: QueT transporter family protein [Clostridia bacterium]|nr:QueT transporter family protein [Clostridia bacterium]
MKTSTESLRRLTQAGLIAAVYAALTLCIPVASYGMIQLRLAEVLTILPVFSAAAVPGLAVGCLLANALGVCFGLTGAWDLLFGTAATLLAAVCTRRLREVRWFGLPILSALMPVVFNAAIVGFELAMFFAGTAFTLPLYGANALWVGLGELLAATIGGLLLFATLRKTGADKKLFV